MQDLKSNLYARGDNERPFDWIKHEMHLRGSGFADSTIFADS